METKKYFSFSLQEIADWTLKENDSWDKPHARIPSFQRGLVWNPAQIEVLWDSLFRGIPIGVLSLISAKDSPQYGDAANAEQLFWLLDGQQRANAITLGFQDFPQNGSILWIDLLPKNELIKKSNRKFFFYITTPAQPWGYKINDANGENRNGTLSAPERRRSMDTLHTSNTKDQQTIVEKPAPEKLYPITAECPIPFALFREYCKGGNDASREEKSKLLAIVEQNKTLNSFLKEKLKVLLESRWDEIAVTLGALRHGLFIAENTIVTALVAPKEISQNGQDTGKDADETQRDSDIAVYFARLNRGGSLPSNEELNYSILKSIAPALAKIDDLAENRMQPARLAHIAMLCYLSLNSEKWEGQIYRKTVYTLASDPNFPRFISDNFEQALTILHDSLGYNSYNNPNGLLPVLQTSIAKNAPSLYQMLLILVCMGKHVRSEFLTGFVTLVAWFNNGVDFSALYKMVISEKEKNFEEIGKMWLFMMLQSGELLLPPEVGIYTTIYESVNPSNAPALDRVYTAWNPVGYQPGVNRIWYWNQREAREMLLYVCRAYMTENFGSYDPASVVWNEDSCPWDYDHIFPQNWIVSGHGNRQGKMYHELVETFFNCIGNIAPLHFSLNRGKSDDAPGEYFSFKEKLFIAGDNILFSTKPKSYIEYDETGNLPFRYTSVIAQRLHFLYSKWYSDLSIGSLLDFDELNDDRKKLFKSLCEKDQSFNLYYVVESGKQLPLNPASKTDWARTWISCGIEAKIKIATAPYAERKCLVCIASNGKNFEIGLRRHPEDDKIYENPGRWWFDQDYASPEIKNILQMLRDSAREKNIQLIERYN